MTEMVFTRKIPDNMRPWKCVVNEREYVYPAGTTQDVPEEVAVLIDKWYEEHEHEYPDNRISFNDLKDRPFYEEKTVLFEQTVEFTDGEWMSSGALPISAGDQVKVTFDGVEYELTAKAAPVDPAMVMIGGADNGIPFAMATGSMNGEGMLLIGALGYDTASIKIEGTKVKTIDPKFIPAGVGGGVVIVQDSAMASGVMPAEQAAPTATMNAAQIAEAVFAGKAVYVIDPIEGTLFPFEMGYRFGELRSGVMMAFGLPDPYAQFGYINEYGAHHIIKVYMDGSYEYISHQFQVAESQ